MSHARKIGLVAAGLLSMQAAQAVVAYNEGVSGDLSNVGTAPTSVALVLGSNQVLGSTGNPGTGIDLDYFFVTVPAGTQLVSLRVLPGSSVLGSLSFIGVQTGSQVTVSPTAGTAAGLLGWSHYSGADIGSDILPRIGTGFGASGFTGALGPGSYAFWVQDTGFGTTPYAFDLQLSPVPEPTALLMAATGVAGLLLRTRRRSPTGA